MKSLEQTCASTMRGSVAACQAMTIANGGGAPTTSCRRRRRSASERQHFTHEAVFCYTVYVAFHVGTGGRPLVGMLKLIL